MCAGMLSIIWWTSSKSLLNESSSSWNTNILYHCVCLKSFWNSSSPKSTDHKCPHYHIQYLGPSRSARAHLKRKELFSILPSVLFFAFSTYRKSPFLGPKHAQILYRKFKSSGNWKCSPWDYSGIHTISVNKQFISHLDLQKKCICAMTQTQ